MKRSEASRYALWSASLAVFLILLTVGAYARRAFLARIEKRNAPESAPVDVERRLNGINFSKVEGDRKIFTVEAQKSTDFKGANSTLLEAVKITVFGKTGDRHDVIHTKSCKYDKTGGGVDCGGEVLMDLQSASDVERISKLATVEKSATPAVGAAPQILHVETRGVTFDRSSGSAQTREPISFTFPGGRGQAVGLEYQSDVGTVRLLHDVSLNVTPPVPSAKQPGTFKPASEVHVTGSSLDFSRDTRVMNILGPAQAETAIERLRAGQITLELDEKFRARKLLANHGAGGLKPHVVSVSDKNPFSLAADTLIVIFASEGWATRLEATGAVSGSQVATNQTNDFSADSGALDLVPRFTQPKELRLNGSVLLKTAVVIPAQAGRQSSSGESREVRTEALRLTFTPPVAYKSAKIKLAETLSPGVIQWDTPDNSTSTPGTATTKLVADKLALNFNSAGQAQQLNATGNVRTERAAPGKALQLATAHSGVAQLLPVGGWSQMDLQGDVRIKDGARAAQSDHASFRRVEQTATLTGKAMVRDASTETHATRITFDSASGDIRADGAVRSTDLSAQASSVRLAPAPANVSADNLRANSKSGHALYSGHARLWQGDSVLQADTIELLRDTKVLNAAGNVRGVFLQSPQRPAQSQQPETSIAAPASSANSTAVSNSPAASNSTTASTTKIPTLWHVSSSTLTYRDADSTAHLEKNVIVRSADQRIHAAALELYFAPANPKSAPTPQQNPSAMRTGSQQISRAVATGGVTVEQAGRKAVADHGEYTASDGKFVMSGGNPTLYDADQGTTSGRQLTFFLADDTIIVDSEKGSRILTKHRVQK